MRRLMTAFILTCAALWAGWVWFAASPSANTIPDDGGSPWTPRGKPIVPPTGLATNAPVTFHTMHVGLNNSDQLWIATAPQQEIAWSVEEDLYIPEGPTIDNAGRVYFSPLFPREDISLVALDGATGERLWTLPHNGDRQGAGAPLILTDPDGSGQQIVYHATYHHAWAVRPDGEILWHAPTGLVQWGDTVPAHAWGMNYLASHDALVLVTGDGRVTALNRKTGKRIAAPFELPGASAAGDTSNMPAQWALQRGDAVARERFGELPDGGGLFTKMVKVIYGAGSEVSNYYAVDQHSGRLYIAATAPDKADGSIDGVSENGALYALELALHGHVYRFKIVAGFLFEGGTGSTPTVSNDGQRVYVSDENGNIFALDSDLSKLWEINLGEQVAASLAVSADNSEIYAVTRNHVFKLFDRGDSATIAWTGQLDAFPHHSNINALTPTITANGVAVSIGASRELGNTSLLKKAGFGLLDRATGKLRGFVESPEESISVTVVDQDGGFTIAHSPVRRLGSAAIFGDAIEPVRGGITKFKSSDDLLLAREAACSAAKFAARRAALDATATAERRWDSAQIDALLEQAHRALARTRSAVDSNQGVDFKNAIALCAALGGRSASAATVSTQP